MEIKKETERKNQPNINKILSNLESSLELINPELREWSLKYFLNHKNRYLNDLRVISTYYNKGKILEVGSIPCHLTYCLKNMGYDITGIDIDPNRASQFIREKELKIIKCDIEFEKMPLKDNEFDLVMFNEVFEHLRINPILTLREINRIMKTNSILILTTPNLYSLEKIVFFNTGRGFNNPYEEFNKLNTLGHAGHIREYSTKEIKQFLNNTGFKVLKVEYTDYGKIKWRFNLKDIIKKNFHGTIPSLKTSQIIIAKKL